MAPPRVVSPGRHRVRRSWHLPAFQVLGADRETEGVGCGGTAESEVFGHLVGVVEFGGDGGEGVAVGGDDGLGVLGVGVVD
ncbi:hypothetical protein BDV28DRAFT_144083 [Aspergillus coremiiformis]|uniref:Uncharacterized protein n=1 Tax=Aspergillus coremiiformis TaxID=138285 RepID=A0A5N6YS12_9EURO|nr:hypothetical protein BDV28DRAFT_144083 [Aspergillus coremiiformis]